jgi:DNA-binding beta-propeller fold protein YncE
MKSFFAVTFFLLILLNGFKLSAQGTFKPYHLQKIVRIHDSNKWDYLCLDDEHHNLFISHQTKVLVFNLDKDTVITEIPNTKGVHGIALNTNLGKGYTSNGKGNSISVFNLMSLLSMDTLNVEGKNPDAILFDQFSNQLFTFNGKSKNASAIDPLSLKVNKLIDLDGKPEFAVSDGKGKIFVNLEDKSEVVEIDAKEKKVTTRWSIAPGSEPTGLAIDMANHLLFSVCDNKLLVVSDYNMHKVICTTPIGSDCDALVFDASTKIIYTSNGEGTISVIQQQSANEYKLLQTIVTQKGCKTLMLDTKTKRIYLPAAKFEDGKKGIVPNSFELWEFSNN